MSKRDDRQLELPMSAARPKLRVISGLGQRQEEALTNRDAVARVLIEAGADLLLRRISPERAEVIEREVDEVLRLFDLVDRNPLLMSVLRRKLDELDELVRDTRDKRTARRRR